MKRVLYHHRTQGKAVEGVHIRGISDALRAEGIHVDILSLPGADPYSSPKTLSPTKQATWWMKLISKLPEPLFEFAEISYNLIAGWRIWRYIKQHPDVDFIYERYSLYMFAPILIARWLRIPIILEINDSATVYRVRPLYFSKIALAVERWALRKAQGLVFVSTVFRDRVAHAHGPIAPTIISPNAANISKFSFTAEQRQAARTKWQLDGHIVCGYLGAFLPWHAIDQFVYQIADRLKQAPKLKLLLVGDGITYPVLQKFIIQQQLTNQIILTGRVAHDDVPGLLAAMDIAILPSAGDYTSPVKLFEFMACAIPPLAPDFAPIQEVLREGQTGWFFRAGQLDHAVERLLALCQQPAELARVGQAARSYIAAERQWRHNALQLLDFAEQAKKPAALNLKNRFTAD